MDSEYNSPEPYNGKYNISTNMVSPDAPFNLNSTNNQVFATHNHTAVKNNNIEKEADVVDQAANVIE